MDEDALIGRAPAARHPGRATRVPRAVFLRARRARGNEARLYTATYFALDHSDNQTAGAATVQVTKHP